MRRIEEYRTKHNMITYYKLDAVVSVLYLAQLFVGRGDDARLHLSRMNIKDLSERSSEGNESVCFRFPVFLSDVLSEMGWRSMDVLSVSGEFGGVPFSAGYDFGKGFAFVTVDDVDSDAAGSIVSALFREEVSACTWHTVAMMERYINIRPSRRPTWRSRKGCCLLFSAFL